MYDFQLASAPVLPTGHQSMVRSQLPRFGAFAETSWSTFCIIHSFPVDTPGHIAGLTFGWACPVSWSGRNVEAKWKTTYLHLGDTHPAGFSQGFMMHFSWAAVHKLENSQVCMLVQLQSAHFQLAGAKLAPCNIDYCESIGRPPAGFRSTLD